jgi:hypothetical protein
MRPAASKAVKQRVDRTVKSVLGFTRSRLEGISGLIASPIAVHLELLL